MGANLNKKSILLVVEGQVAEPRILGSATHGILSLIGSDYNIHPFANSIYELYEAYRNGEYDNLVSFLRAEKGLKLSSNVLSRDAFSAIYLVFDYEPHYQKYSDEVIKDLLNVFDNETDQGKLYINYPMVEAYYDLHAPLPDYAFFERCVSLEGFSGKDYKRSINLSTCFNKSCITSKELAFIIWHHYVKAKKITSCKREIDYQLLLDYQLAQKASHNSIYSLSTLPLLAVDYNPDETFRVVEKLLKDSQYKLNT